MSKTIQAVYEEGVLKPLQKVRLREHEKVEIQIFSPEEWKKRFNRVIERIHKKTSRFQPEEIEADIAQAIKEHRVGKRGRSGRH